MMTGFSFLGELSL